MGGFHTVYRIRIRPQKTNTTTSKYAFSPPLCGFASESKTPRLQKKDISTAPRKMTRSDTNGRGRYGTANYKTKNWPQPFTTHDRKRYDRSLGVLLVPLPKDFLKPPPRVFRNRRQFNRFC